MREGDFDSFDAAFVCTANRARSALAEALYRRYSLGFATHARSFGTRDVGAAPPLKDAVEAGRRLGIDLGSHTAGALTPNALVDVDLVLGFEPHHVAAAVIDAGADPARSFLLGELVGLLEVTRPDGTVQAARANVAAADERRRGAASSAARFLIPDPAGASSRVMLATASEIDELVRRLIRNLFGRPSTRH